MDPRPLIQFDGHTVVTLPAEIDLVNAEQITGQLADLLTFASCNRLILDLSKTTFLSGSGVRGLAEAFRQARRRGVSMRLVSQRRAVKLALRLSGADDLLPVFDSVDHALGQHAHAG